MNENSTITVKAGLVLLGRSLETVKDACIWIKDGLIEAVTSSASCPARHIGSSNILVTPQPALAHVHSMDHAFPEYGINKDISELVAYPSGEKHVMLNALTRDKMISYTAEYYRYAWRLGVGLVVDFRELGGLGCTTAKEAHKIIPEGLSLLVLGRPGPGWPMGCDGLGISSPLDYPKDELRKLVSSVPIAATHVAETKETREQGDLEIALDTGFHVLIHGTYLDRDDIVRIFSEKKNLVLCTRSNMWHSLRVPPIDDIVKLGASFGLGTDNAAWLPPDPWGEAMTLLFAGRLKGYKEPLLAKRILEGLFINGYTMYGLRPRLVEEGVKAGFLVWNIEDTGLSRAEDVYVGVVKRLVSARLLARVDEGVISWV